eukprot:g13317.t1
MKMMAPTRRTLFFSAIAALWCCYSITIAAAGRNGQMIQLTVGGIRLAEGIYVIDLNKDGNIGAELELAAPDAGGDGTFICVRRPELVEASAIVHLKRGLQTQPILNAVQRVEEKSLEVGEVGGGWFGDVGGGWFGPVGVRTENHYAVYLFQLKADGLAPEPPASLQSHFGAAFPVYLRLPWKVDTEAASSSTKTYQFYLMETLLHPMMFAAPQHAADVSQASGSTENDQRRSAPAYLSPVLSPAVADEAGTSASQPAAVEAGARASSSEEEDVEMAPPPGLPLLRRLEGQA